MRREGLAKLAGRTRFLADLSSEGAWWGGTVRSPVPRGRIRSVRFGLGIDWGAVVCVDARDIPGQNAGALFDSEQPVLADGEVRHRHEPVLLLAHPSRRVVREAVRAVAVVVDEQPASLDFVPEPDPALRQVGEDNVFHLTRCQRGCPESVLRDAGLIVEGVYRCGAQEHLYLESQGVHAAIEGGTVVVHGSLQCPGYVQSALARVLAREPGSIRVCATPVGGGFGGKEDYPSLLAAHAALLASKAGRPVRMLHDRLEDMVATTKRHAAWIRHRTAVSPDGEFLAMAIDILLDAGAYATLSPIVLNRATVHATGPYRCPNVLIQGRARMTNTVPSGAFRGFGNPQVHFAVERHVDRIAEALQIDPAVVRRRNLLVDGDRIATGQVINDGVSPAALLDRALELVSADTKRTAHARFNRESTWRRRGLGHAASFHGAGLPVQVEAAIASRVNVEARPDGSVRLMTSIVEMGQGAETVLAGLVARRLQLPDSAVEVAPPDTASVPDSGPSVASRTSMVVGLLVEQACDDLRQRLGLSAMAGGAELQHRIRERMLGQPDGRIAGEGVYDPGPPASWDPERFQGTAYPAFGWAAQVAEVEVDLRTGAVTVLDLVSVQDVGTVLHPVLAKGQVQGGVAQAVGWALTEHVVVEDGGMQNGTLTDYVVPTSADLPPIRVAFVETPSTHGARGARGLGELPMVGPAAAVVNAISRALRAPVDRIPARPEDLMTLLSGGSRG